MEIVDECLVCDDGVYESKLLINGTLYKCNKCGHCEITGDAGEYYEEPSIPYDHMNPPEYDPD